MSEKIENPLLGHLKNFQAGQNRIENKLDEIVHRLGHLEITSAGIKREIASADEADAMLSVRLDKMGDRIDRIEKRLELAS